jgi:hypothetical protein
MTLTLATLEADLIKGLNDSGAFHHFSALFLQLVISAAESTDQRSLLQTISTTNDSALLIAIELSLIFLHKHNLTLTLSSAAAETHNKLISTQSSAWLRKKLKYPSSTKSLSTMLSHFGRRRQKSSPILRGGESDFFAKSGSARPADLTRKVVEPTLRLHDCGAISIEPVIPLPEEEEEEEQVEVAPPPPPPELHHVRVKLTVVSATKVLFQDQLLAQVDPYCRLCFNETVFETQVKQGQEPEWNEAFNFEFDDPPDDRNLQIWMIDDDDDDTHDPTIIPEHAFAKLDVELPSVDGKLQRTFEMVSVQAKSGVGILAAPEITLGFETMVEVIVRDD